MQTHHRKFRSDAKPSCASGGCATPLLPIAWKRQGIASSPSPRCRQANGKVHELPTPSNDCTKSSNAASKLKPCCHPPTRQQCSSGRCWRQGRSSCERSMAGRRSHKNRLLSLLTEQPDQITSSYRRFGQTNSNHIRDGTVEKPTS